METTGTGTQRNVSKNLEGFSQTAHQAVDRATSAASQMAERFGEKGEELLAMKDTWVESTREYVREHPIQAVGIAVAAGYLFSVITRWSR
jgi:ElaB/YqjD/DUF883 family membrane-anchored ribosome-binding protein